MTKQELLEELRTTATEQPPLLQEGKRIPITVFSTEMSPLQAIVTYLHDHDQETFPNIAKQLHRSYRAVWGAYQHNGITITTTKQAIPIACFDDKKSILETVVHYLRKDRNMKFTEIAQLLNKDPRTVWTVWNRAQEKKNGKNR